MCAGPCRFTATCQGGPSWVQQVKHMALTAQQNPASGGWLPLLEPLPGSLQACQIEHVMVMCRRVTNRASAQRIREKREEQLNTISEQVGLCCHKGCALSRLLHGGVLAICWLPTSAPSTLWGLHCTGQDLHCTASGTGQLSGQQVDCRLTSWLPWISLLAAGGQQGCPVQSCGPAREASWHRYQHHPVKRLPVGQLGEGPGKAATVFCSV